MALVTQAHHFTLSAVNDAKTGWHKVLAIVVRNTHATVAGVFTIQNTVSSPVVSVHVPALSQVVVPFGDGCHFDGLMLSAIPGGGTGVVYVYHR